MHICIYTQGYARTYVHIKHVYVCLCKCIRICKQAIVTNHIVVVSGLGVDSP